MKQEWTELNTTYKSWGSGTYTIGLYYQVVYKAGYLIDSSGGTYSYYRCIGKFDTLEQAKEACEKHERLETLTEDDNVSVEEFVEIWLKEHGVS